MSSWVRVLQGRRRLGLAAHVGLVSLLCASVLLASPAEAASPVVGSSYVDAGPGGVTSSYFMVRAITAADISRLG
ncbi:MAG: hypothetical protein WBP61_01820 [Nocardioides sp.]